MSRIIKFRAWTKDWDGVYRMSFSDKYEEDEIPTSAHQLMSYFFRNLNPNAELMQSTGLHDKNGKEIYEGDIIKCGGDDLPTVVVWHERYASFGLRRDGWMYTHFFGEAVDNTDCEIISNIYQNPELLNPNQP